MSQQAKNKPISPQTTKPCTNCDPDKAQQSPSKPQKLFDIHGLGSVWSKPKGKLQELLESPPSKRRAFGITVK